MIAEAKRRRAVALVMGAVLLLAFWRSRPPSPLTESAPAERFSAGRAVAELTAVLADEGPHPVGSQANARVRERIAQRLTERGFEVRTTRHVGCSPRGICSELHNLIALRDAGPDVALLAAHYDSVGAGVGAADDGSAVGALLETARLLAAQPKVAAQNTIAILLTDGEEAGLLGAKAFAHRDPLFKRVRAVVNLEARGTTGPSLMFEAGGKTAAIVDHLRALERPHTSSLFAAVYELLPNDTDFSVFRDAGAAGFNFAFIDGVARYHTSFDDLEHLDHGSVQHHGDNLWALTRSLQGADLGALHRGDDAVWFDVLGWGLVDWPAPYSLPLACLALVLLAASVARHLRRQGEGARDLGRAVGVALLTPIVAALVGAAVGFVVELPSTSAMPRLSATLVPFVALLSASAAVALALAGLLGRAKGWMRFYGLWLVWAALGVVVSVVFPPACYLFVAPSILAALMGLFASGDPSFVPASLVGVVVATLLWGSVAIGLVSALGFAAPFAIAAALGFLFSTALPLLADGRARRRPVTGLAAFAFCLSLAAGIVSPHDDVEPQRMSIVHAQIDGASEWWIDSSWGALPEPLLALLVDEREGEPPLPLVGVRRAVVAAGPELGLPAPEVERLPSGADRVRLRLTSPRGAGTTGILFPPTLSLPMVRVAGQPMVPGTLEQGRFEGHRVCLCLSSRPNGCVVELPSPPVGTALTVFDMARGAPDAARDLVEARAAAHGVASQDGDLSLVATTWTMP